MLDNRKSIVSGTQFVFDDNRYTVMEEAGRGSSCIVYHAFYYDQVNQKHLVRIKECYPYNIDIRRTEDGSLEAEPACNDSFLDAKKKFFDAYTKNTDLNSTLGLINSTVNAMNIYSFNNTWYSVMVCVEGRDYCSDLDQDIKSLFTRMLALAEIIKKYHDKGFLHLDIKPENILIIPETKEHMVLFDFDSLLSKEDLNEDSTVRFSFSDGYAAPELVRGNRKKICEATDIFSIGAIVFYKLFGRKPDAFDCMVSTVYDFKKIRKPDERYQPELFRALSTFFHKTIAASVSCRYKTVDELILAIKNIIAISDIESTFLFHNFTYNSAGFIGRRYEIESIKRIFDSGQQVLFLSGTGGIGKTELARRYAFEYMDHFRKIVFVPFSGSIMHTVCGNDFRINRIEKGEEETEEDYFWRKLEVLKKVTSPDDLVIIDNFDIEEDEHLEDLFACSCKFLLTTREDFRDFDYEQIDVEKFENMDDLLTLFQVYNSNFYQEAEMQHIRDIIELVERHTMTVVLIAKYLRTTDDRPEALLKKFMQKEGITNTQEIHIKHRKDRQARAKSMNSHLLVLFDLSGFTEEERELIRSLSLLGYVYILKEKFIEYCPIENGAEALEKLIKKGWIEQNHFSNKISLHQIILDLVYHYLHPVSENCPHIMDAMAGYLMQDMVNYAERTIRRKLLDIFMERVHGEDVRYVRLCVLFCNRVRKEPEYLDAAEKICLRIPEHECNDLLQKIYRMKMMVISAGDDMFHQMLKEDEFDTDQYFEESSKEMCNLAEKAYSYAKKYSDDFSYLANFCVETAFELDEASTNNMITLVIDGNNDAMNRMLDLAVQLFDDAENYLLMANMEDAEKIRLLRKMQEFFSEDEFSALYRCSHYADAARNFHYQEIIDRLRGQKDDDTIYLNDVTYGNLAEEAERNGEFQKAIDLHYKAYEVNDEFYYEALTKISDIYQKIGDMDRAVSALEKILKIDKASENDPESYFSYTDYVCADLIDLLMAECRFDEARNYAEELIHYNEEDTEDSNSIQWIIAARYRLYKMETEPQKKQLYWDACVAYFFKLEKDAELSDAITEFLIDYADSQKNVQDKMEYAFDFLARTRTYYDANIAAKFLDYIINVCKNNKKFIAYHIRALLQYSETLREDISKQEQALKYCKEADKLYEENGLDDEYLFGMIHKTMGDCYSSANYDYDLVLDEKRKCNFYLLAQYDAYGKSEKQQIKLWKDAASEYHYVDNYMMEEKCFIHLFEIITPILNKYDYSSFHEYWSSAKEQLQCLLELGDKEQLKLRTFDLYDKTVWYYTEICTEEDAQRKADDFRWNVEYCADFLLKGEFQREAFVLYIIAIIVAADTQPEHNILLHIQKYIDGKWEELSAELSRVLHGSISDKNVDDVIDIYEALIPILKQDKTLAEFGHELQWFSSIYKYQNIEFKRE